MAIYLNKLTKNELLYLTDAMAKSAKIVDLSDIKKPGKYIVDKHSTGGVGDKVTLIVLPIVAALGVDVFKMSGRGLGFTGGTADKLEAIQGYNINISLEQACHQVQTIGECLISQSPEIAIADKKLYALRDTTATVESIDLIASSIMSKKLALGADKILLDVTVGSGAFMKTLENARKLAETLVEIGKMAGRETKAIITDMNGPLGRNVGNALEIKEVISFLLADETTLSSNEVKDLKDVVFEIAAYMIKMAGCGDDIEINKKRIMEVITTKKAYDKFIELVKAQGGHIYEVYMDWIGMNLDMPVLKDNVKYMKEIHAQTDGYIVSMDSKKIGEALVCLGGGRLKKDDEIDYAVGFEFVKKVGDKVKEGETILKVLYNDKEKFNNAFDYLEDAIYIDDITEELAIALKKKPHVLDIIG
jgi:pyrimidine-nucleoside phosphorylase